MNAPIAKRESAHITEMSESELMNVLRNSMYPGAQDESIKMVLGYCKAAGLDPMQKPVHIVPMWDGKARTMRDVIMPGIGCYRTQAARSGEYAGVSEPEFGPDVNEEMGGVKMTYPAWCRVVVKRLMPNGMIAEFAATERWRENYATKGKDSAAPNAMWQKRPYGQLAKCSESQALRKAFPEVGAQPTADEMEGKSFEDAVTVIDSSTGEIISKQEAPRGLPLYTDAQLEKNLPTWQKSVDTGKTTADKIIAKVTSGYRLTPEHEERIRAMKKQWQPTEEELAEIHQREMEESGHEQGEQQ